MKTTHLTPRGLVAETRRVLGAWRPSDKHSPLDQVAEQLAEGRNYQSLGIYLVLGDTVRLIAHAGSAPASDSVVFGEENVGAVAKNGITKVQDIAMPVRDGKPELAVPIKMAARVLGVLDVKSPRITSSDNILVHEVAHLIARFLTSKGKLLVRKQREQAAAAAAGSLAKPYRPTSDKNPAETNMRRAAAGDSSRA